MHQVKENSVQSKKDRSGPKCAAKFGKVAKFAAAAKSLRTTGLNACLCLLPKNVNNFAEINIRSALHMNHRSNTEYYESKSGLVLSLPNLPYPFKTACPEQFALCLNTFRWVKDNWPQPTGAA